MNPERAPVILGSRPFIESVCWNLAATLSEGLAKVRALLYGLGSRVDALARLPIIPRPAIDQAPAGNLCPPALVFRSDDEMCICRCDVVLRLVAGGNSPSASSPSLPATFCHSSQVREKRPQIYSQAYSFVSSSLTRRFRLISAGLRPSDSNHLSKSITRTCVLHLRVFDDY